MPANTARLDRSRTGGDPAQFSDIARELLGTRTAQGAGKTVNDTSAFTSAGNPKSFLEMASTLRRHR